MINQEQLPMVELSSMNDTHLEEIIIANNIATAIKERDKTKITELLEELLEHTITHFSGEEMMMLEAIFPPYLMHKGEHDKGLNELRFHMKKWEEEENFELLDEYINISLKNWIINHIQTMDTVTARFLVHGISPCGSGSC